MWKRGETLGLIGPNGAGKTTVFNLIMKELKQDEGEIYFEEKEISKYQTYERVKMGISRTYQIPRPFGDMTVSENIRVGIMPDKISRIMAMNSQSDTERKIGKSVGFEKHGLSSIPVNCLWGIFEGLS